MTIGAVGYSAKLHPCSSLQRGIIKIFEKLRENKREKKILLAWKSGAHIEQIHEKNRGRKILRYCPFNRNRIYNHPGTPTPNHTDNPNHFHIYLYVLLLIFQSSSAFHMLILMIIYLQFLIFLIILLTLPMLICTYTNNHTAQTYTIHNHKNMFLYPNSCSSSY